MGDATKKRLKEDVGGRYFLGHVEDSGGTVFEVLVPATVSDGKVTVQGPDAPSIVGGLTYVPGEIKEYLRQLLVEQKQTNRYLAAIFGEELDARDEE